MIRRRTFTLVEMVVSVLVMGVMLVAALNTVGAARMGEYTIAERGEALLLGQALMAEILQQAYADPDYGPDSFGLASEEAAPGNRSLWEDVDDYDGWSAGPPQNKDGTVIPGTADYERSVTVDWVAVSDPAVASVSNTGLKRIIVTVNHQGREIIVLTAYRTQTWVDPAELQAKGDW